MSENSDKNNATELIQPSVNQSVATAVQNAADLLRNIITIETSVIGVASAKWLGDPYNPAYPVIIESAKENITFAVENLEKVGSAGASVLKELNPK